MLPGDLDAPILAATAHRPWPTPRRPWLMGMRWHDLLFAHWPVAAATLQPLVPAGLSIETFGGSAWIGVVPFWMSRVRVRGLPSLPPFPELNVRTYVRCGERPGVWFFSLDAHSRLAVAAARTFFHLPYFRADMCCREKCGVVTYASVRTHRRVARACFKASYRPTGTPFHSKPQSLERFLTERYVLYTTDRRSRLWSAEIHHRPWPLQPAEIEIESNTVAAAAGIALPEAAPVCHFAKTLEVVAWRARPLPRPFKKHASG